MAKGGFRGGYGGGGGFGGVNMNMIKQAQKMQADMLKAQAELEEKEYSATVGGVVTATVSGKKQLTALSIAPEAIDPEDSEMLCDTIMAAVNEALKKAEEDMSSGMSKITGGLNLGF